MGLTETISLSPSGRSIQTHFPTDYATQYIFPFDPGEEVRVQIIPHTAVVFLPKEEPVDYPLLVRDPETVKPRTSLEARETRGDGGE